jgi:8-oxo-dGTP pyrophosphatase MutT (NUDIX family)
MGPIPPRDSAVMLLLFQQDGEDHIIFTRRTEQVATHKGQISLPGGAAEPTDESLLHTALRETEEELGITPDKITVLAELEDVFTVVTNFVIRPFVGRLSSRPVYHPDPAEVAEVIEVPVSALRNPDFHWQEERTGPFGPRWIHFFKYQHHIIWGATARILTHFLENGQIGRE